MRLSVHDAGGSRRERRVDQRAVRSAAHRAQFTSVVSGPSDSDDRDVEGTRAQAGLVGDVQAVTKRAALAQRRRQRRRRRPGSRSATCTQVAPARARSRTLTARADAARSPPVTRAGQPCAAQASSDLPAPAIRRGR